MKRKQHGHKLESDIDIWVSDSATGIYELPNGQEYHTHPLKFLNVVSTQHTWAARGSQVKIQL